MALLDVRDLKIAFYDTTPPTEVVKGISFSLEEGETLGIVGESGSGKTQTALSILHLLKENSAVSGGEILYEDSSVAHASSQDLQRIRGKEISMIFQEPMTSLNPVLTIEEQIAEGLLIHESCTPAERHEKVLAIMHEVELSDPEKLCKKYPHQLSGGQRQRVMIAAALITGPKLLIADEPTTALDVTIQSQILKLLKKINERHHTAILFISHDLGVLLGRPGHRHESWDDCGIRQCRRCLFPPKGRLHPPPARCNSEPTNIAAKANQNRSNSSMADRL